MHCFLSETSTGVNDTSRVPISKLIKSSRVLVPDPPNETLEEIYRFLKTFKSFLAANKIVVGDVSQNFSVIWEFYFDDAREALMFKLKFHV